mmetsp:Transcript_2030/g.5960  ORF Transcript_2030/g.5960 Transcript_2030/m.5960 type:complete len:382 (+) Transcript_2030:1076-2221(+)
MSLLAPLLPSAALLPPRSVCKCWCAAVPPPPRCRPSSPSSPAMPLLCRRHAASTREGLIGFLSRSQLLPPLKPDTAGVAAWERTLLFSLPRGLASGGYATRPAPWPPLAAGVEAGAWPAAMTLASAFGDGRGTVVDATRACSRPLPLPGTGPTWCPPTCGAGFGGERARLGGCAAGTWRCGSCHSTCGMSWGRRASPSSVAGRLAAANMLASTDLLRHAVGTPAKKAPLQRLGGSCMWHSGVEKPCTGGRRSDGGLLSALSLNPDHERLGLGRIAGGIAGVGERVRWLLPAPWCCRCCATACSGPTDACPDPPTWTSLGSGAKAAMAGGWPAPDSMAGGGARPWRATGVALPIECCSDCRMLGSGGCAPAAKAAVLRRFCI